MARTKRTARRPLPNYSSASSKQQNNLPGAPPPPPPFVLSCSEQARRTKEVFDNRFLVLIDNLQFSLFIVSYLTGDDFSRLFVASGRDSCMKAPLLGLSDASDVYHLLKQRKPSVKKIKPQLEMGFAKKTIVNNPVTDLIDLSQTSFQKGLKTIRSQIDLLSTKKEFDLTGKLWQNICDSCPTCSKALIGSGLGTSIPYPRSTRTARQLWSVSAAVVEHKATKEFKALPWGEKRSWENAEWAQVEADCELMLQWTVLAKVETTRYELEAKRYKIGNLSNFVTPLPLPLLKKLDYSLGFAGGLKIRRRDDRGFSSSFTSNESVSLLSIPEKFFVNSFDADMCKRVLVLCSTASTYEGDGGGGCGCCGTNEESSLRISSMSLIKADGSVYPLMSFGVASRTENEEEDGEAKRAVTIDKSNCLELEKILFGLNLRNGQIGLLLNLLSQVHEQNYNNITVEQLHNHTGGTGANKEEALFDWYEDFDHLHEMMVGEDEGGDGGEGSWALMTSKDLYQLKKFGTGPGLKAFPHIELGNGSLRSTDDLRSNFLAGTLVGISVGIAKPYVSLEHIALTALKTRLESDKSARPLGNLRLCAKVLEGWEESCNAEIIGSEFVGEMRNDEYDY